MNKSITITLLLLAFQNINYAQEINGEFSALPNQYIKLHSYENFKAYAVDSIQTDAQGRFNLQFSKKDYGMGFLTTKNAKSFILVLENGTITLQGETPTLTEGVKILDGKQNMAFKRFVTEQPKREQVLSAWEFLLRKYHNDSLFSTHAQPKTAIVTEIERLDQEEENFLTSLSEDSYIKWFLPIRKLLSNVSVVAQYRADEIPATRDALREIDYADERLYKSGLLRETVESYIWFIENSSGSLDNVFKDLNTSIDIMIEQLKNDDEKFNLIASKWFEVLEERSLYTSSEYLSKRLLEGDDCGCLNSNLKKRLHKYGEMATGETAPDINFTRYTYYPEGVTVKKLSDLEADYYLVVFAASWCLHCTEAMPKITDLYPELKSKNIEVVLVSLDENIKAFSEFAAPLPFISTTDLKKWDSKFAKDYQVYGTPSYFMLDSDLKIKMKLKSLEHIKAWAEWNVD